MAEVFLSHNRGDRPWVRKLHASLQDSGVTDIFRDETSIHPGERLVQALEAGLEDTILFIIVWSANAATSRWVPAERELALIGNIQGGLPFILPICLDQTPVPGFMQIFVRLAATRRGQPGGLAMPQLAREIVRSLEAARRQKAQGD